MLEDRFTDLTPASIRTEQVRQADAVSGSGVDHDGFAPEPADRRLDLLLIRIVLACPAAAGFAGLAGWIFTHAQNHQGDGLALVFAIAAWLLIMIVKRDCDEIHKLFNSRRGHAPQTGISGECAAGGYAIPEGPPAATYPYQLDNEPLVPTNVFTLRRK